MENLQELERIKQRQKEIGQKRLEESKEAREKYDELDEEILDSFPASDPPSHTPPKKD